VGVLNIYDIMFAHNVDKKLRVLKVNFLLSRWQHRGRSLRSVTAWYCIVKLLVDLSKSNVKINLGVFALDQCTRYQVHVCMYVCMYVCGYFIEVL